jgi:hypothetical protein
VTKRFVYGAIAFEDTGNPYAHIYGWKPLNRDSLWGW